eukprot:SAG11_NODE_480_length_9107_cov_7.433171_2_plen_1065_part_00
MRTVPSVLARVVVVAAAVQGAQRPQPATVDFARLGHTSHRKVTGFCTSDMDCSLNGVCSAVGLCRCDQPWSGPSCGKLTFRPASLPGAAAYGLKPNVSSWGASPIQATGQWHIFVSEIAGRRCGLAKWSSQSRVAHATAPTAMGPYQKQDVALAVESHNPHAVAYQGAYLLFHIGSAASTHPVQNCTSSETFGGEPVPPGVGARLSATTTADGVSSTVTALIHRSHSLNGPWVPAKTTMPGPCVNPAPWVMSNGSLAVVCSGADLHNRTWHLLVSDAMGLTGRWTSRPIFAGVSPPTVRPHKFWEDPVLFMDAQNHWHILAHCYVPHYDESNDYVSGHLFSEDGLIWNESGVEPYRHTVSFQGGQVQNFSTLERPKLVVDASGRPTHLFNGVSSTWPCSACGGCTSCKVTPGTDWTYTLVRELGHMVPPVSVPALKTDGERRDVVAFHSGRYPKVWCECNISALTCIVSTGDLGTANVQARRTAAHATVVEVAHCKGRRLHCGNCSHDPECPLLGNHSVWTDELVLNATKRGADSIDLDIEGNTSPVWAQQFVTLTALYEMWSALFAFRDAPGPALGSVHSENQSKTDDRAAAIVVVVPGTCPATGQQLPHALGTSLLHVANSSRTPPVACRPLSITLAVRCKKAVSVQQVTRLKSTDAPVSSGSLRWLTFYNAMNNGAADTHSNLVTNEHIGMLVAWHERFGVRGLLDVHRPGNTTHAKLFTRPRVFNFSRPGLQGGGLRSNWRRDLSWTLDAAMPHLQSGAISGIFLGDEPCCSGAASFENLSSVAAFAKARLAGTDAFVYVNECSRVVDPAFRYAGSWHAVPAGLDVVSMDGYCLGSESDPQCPPADEAKMMRGLYEQWLLPKMSARQRLGVVPGLFGNYSQPIPAQDAALTAKLKGYLAWARDEPKLVLMNPWHYSDIGAPPNQRRVPNQHGQRIGPYVLGAYAFPQLMTLVRKLGDKINVSHHPPWPRMLRGYSNATATATQPLRLKTDDRGCRCLQWMDGCVPRQRHGHFSCNSRPRTTERGVLAGRPALSLAECRGCVWLRLPRCKQSCGSTARMLV